MIEINQSIKYTFLEALEKAIDSKNSEINYKIDILNKQNKLKFLNPVIGSWQSCTYVTPEEIFDGWYVIIE